MGRAGEKGGGVGGSGRGGVIDRETAEETIEQLLYCAAVFCEEAHVALVTVRADDPRDRDRRIAVAAQVGAALASVAETADLIGGLALGDEE